MRHCVVKNCSQTDRSIKKDIKYFTFPKNPDMRKKWIEACGKENVNSQTGTICSRHFVEDDWRLSDRLLNVPIAKRFLNKEAVPTQLISLTKEISAINRTNRCEKRTAKKLVNECVQEYDLSLSKLQDQSNAELENENAGNATSVRVQADVGIGCAKDLKIIELERKIKALEKENTILKDTNRQLLILQTSVQHIFTNGQIEKLKNPTKRIYWALDDISSASCLYSAGPRAYRYLYKKDYPLPGPSTIRKWIAKSNVRKNNVSKPC